MTATNGKIHRAELNGDAQQRIFYYTIDPDSGKKIRHRVRIPAYLKGKARKDWINQKKKELNEMLAALPDVKATVDNMRLDEQLIDALNSYMQYCAVEMRPNSLRSYQSYCDRLQEFLRKNKRQKVEVGAFREFDAVMVMEKVTTRRARSPRTYNNYLMAYRRMWNWLVEHKYARENVFMAVTPKKLKPKYRGVIESADRKLIAAHLKENDFRFYMVCALIYFCLLRPNEICQLTPRMINLEGQVITIPGDVSKNHLEQHVTIPNALIPDLVRLLEESKPAMGAYLFSTTATLESGFNKMCPRVFSKRWARMRKLLKLPKKHQLYSLKDTGITELILRGVPANEVMHQARHHSLEVTSVYIARAKRTASDHIKKGLTAF